MGSGPRNAHARDLRPGGRSLPGLAARWPPAPLQLGADGRGESLRASRRRQRRRHAADQESQCPARLIRLPRWHAARVHGDHADDGSGRHAAPAGRHACGDTARADAVQRAQRRSVARWAMARLRGERLGAISHLRAAISGRLERLLAGVNGRRHAAAVGAEQSRAVLSERDGGRHARRRGAWADLGGDRADQAVRGTLRGRFRPKRPDVRHHSRRQAVSDDQGRRQRGPDGLPRASSSSRTGSRS